MCVRSPYATSTVDVKVAWRTSLSTLRTRPRYRMPSARRTRQPRRTVVSIGWCWEWFCAREKEPRWKPRLYPASVCPPINTQTKNNHTMTPIAPFGDIGFLLRYLTLYKMMVCAGVAPNRQRGSDFQPHVVGHATQGNAQGKQTAGADDNVQPHGKRNGLVNRFRLLCLVNRFRLRVHLMCLSAVASRQETVQQGEHDGAKRPRVVVFEYQGQKMAIRVKNQGMPT